MKRILSIDGGGIRGAIPARILSYLEERTGPSALAWDLIAGTSTGGILTAGLTHTEDGKTPTFSAKSLLNFYVEEGATIFHRSWYDVAGVLKVKYPADGLAGTIQKYYRSAMLSQALTEVLITGYDLVKNRPHFFKRWKARANAADNVLLSYAAIATASAPTIFPPWDQYIDGGVFASDPAMCALAEAHYLWPGEEYFLLSLGTGYHANPVDPAKAAEWGGLRWASPVISILMNGNASNVEFQLRQFLPPDRYIRIQAPITGKSPSPAMDDASKDNIQALIAFADQMIVDNKAELDAAALCIRGKG